MAMQVIQPRITKQNGCAEWCQRIWRKEFYETSSVAATLDECRQDARRFVVPTTMSGPTSHLMERRPSGIYANTMERASVAT